MTFRAPPEGAPKPPMLQAMAIPITSILASSGSWGIRSLRLLLYRAMAMGRNMAANAWSEMNPAAGAMTRIRMAVIAATRGLASFRKRSRQIRLSTPVFTKATENMRLPMMNQQASDHMREATSSLDTTPVKTRMSPMQKATPGRGMASVKKQVTTKAAMATATFRCQAARSALAFWAWVRSS